MGNAPFQTQLPKPPPGPTDCQIQRACPFAIFLEEDQRWEREWSRLERALGDSVASENTKRTDLENALKDHEKSLNQNQRSHSSDLSFCTLTA
jgi:hypothetical protein